MDNYKKYKNKLREEFSYSCVYCEIRESELDGSRSFHIDHYRPKSKFPELVNEYKNLLYACGRCNQYKANYWPNPFQGLAGFIVLNPREHEIDNHIDKSKFVWQGKTIQGKWNVKRFRLDSSRLVEKREDRKNTESMIADLKQRKNILEKIMLEYPENKEIKAKLEMTSNYIATLERRINGRKD